MVLHWAFPVGQTAGLDGFFPEAVGRFGNPSQIWTQHADLTSDKYNHSDYWSGRTSKDLRSADEVIGFLGRPVPSAVPSNGIVEHSLPDARELDANTIEARKIGA
jgi:hypothetical protein